MGRITLITGGARSGKSRTALELARRVSGTRRIFIATAEGLDDEMRVRIKNHKESRGDDFETIETPIQIPKEVESLAARADVVVIDCLTIWIANLMQTESTEKSIAQHTQELIAAAQRVIFETVLVSGEVGSGIVPDHRTARDYRDYLGRVNQEIAAVADSVILMVAGIPIRAK